MNAIINVIFKMLNIFYSKLFNIYKSIKFFFLIRIKFEKNAIILK